MSQSRKPLSIGIAAALAAVAILFFANPVMAQEAAAAAAPAAAPSAHASTSMLGQFLMTDSLVGSVVIWGLVLNSCVLMSLIVQTALKNRKSQFVPDDLATQVEALMAEKRFREALELAGNSDSPLGQVIKHALMQAKRGFDAMEQAVFDMAEQIGNDRVRNLVWMEIAGAAGPMMGLFGTVYGMILAFAMLVKAGGTPKPAELAGGIATALVCTFWGLVVGIPGVISATVFRVKIEGLTAQVIWIGSEIVASLRNASPEAAAPARPAAAGAAARPARPAAAAEPAAVPA